MCIRDSAYAAHAGKDGICVQRLEARGHGYALAAGGSCDAGSDADSRLYPHSVYDCAGWQRRRQSRGDGVRFANEMCIRDRDALYAKMKEQVDVAIDMADVIVFFVDGKHGSPSPDDEDVATLLRHRCV